MTKVSEEATERNVSELPIGCACVTGEEPQSVP